MRFAPQQAQAHPWAGVVWWFFSLFFPLSLPSPLYLCPKHRQSTSPPTLCFCHGFQLLSSNFGIDRSGKLKQEDFVTLGSEGMIPPKMLRSDSPMEWKDAAKGACAYACVLALMACERRIALTDEHIHTHIHTRTHARAHSLTSPPPQACQRPL